MDRSRLKLKNMSRTAARWSIATGIASVLVLGGRAAGEQPLLPHRRNQSARRGARRGVVGRRRQRPEPPADDLLHPRRELEVRRLEKCPNSARSGQRNSGLRRSRKAS